MHKTKLLVLAPHPDDELLIAGALIYTLRKKFDITVAFYTNGDSVSEQGYIRIREAIEALSVLGIKEDKIIFLGYGNNWRNGIHIYNLPEKQETMSYAGHSETYCIDEHPEYCMCKWGVHHRYTRSNVKLDIKSLIMDIRADLIICVDFDAHGDHRALSLFFEEVMAEILKTDNSYKPIILKKFAYSGMTSGKWDYYYSPMKETQLGYKSELFDQRYELDNPVFAWDERLQFELNRKTRTRHIHNNILYKAASKHKSQNFADRVGKFANSDIVYWQRRTDGISYIANISATSGNVSYINDFKMIDSDNILYSKEGVESLQNCVWIPDIDDKEKKISIDFADPVRISKIHLYENFLPSENILKAKILFDTGKKILVENINHKGRKTKLVFDTQYNVYHMEFCILSSEGERAGLTELEIYEEDNEQNIPLKYYKKSKRKCRNIENDMDIILEKKFWDIKADYTKENKFYRFYQFLLKWNMTGSDCVEKWLSNKGYKNIAIYGMGDFGKKLCRDLENTDISVKYAIDKMAGDMWAPFPILRMDLLENILDVDVIIVTTLNSYNKVKRDLNVKGYDINRIMSIEEIIDDVMYLT